MSVFNRLRAGLRLTTNQLSGLFANAVTREIRDVDGDVAGEGSVALEEILLQADIGVAATERLLEVARSQGGTADVRTVVKAELRRLLDGTGGARPTSVRPRVVLVVGVNGTGKTTSVGKLAHLLAQAGERVVICAADTFRAAAVEQLEIWAGRANADFVRARSGTDPAAVVFDALSAGKARGRDVVLIDTAGRLHTDVNLMRELDKIKRVAGQVVSGAPHETLLVLDATVGQNGLAQGRAFLETAGVTGVVLTKLDGTAKGGVAAAITSELGVPIRYVGVGEKLDDLLPFSSEQYVEALFEPVW